LTHEVLETQLSRLTNDLGPLLCLLRGWALSSPRKPSEIVCEFSLPGLEVSRLLGPPGKFEPCLGGNMRMFFDKALLDAFGSFSPRSNSRLATAPSTRHGILSKPLSRLNRP